MLNKSQNNHRPIGIFDSGIGGLTIAKQIATSMPTEKIIYIGDTANSPWGDKSKKNIEAYLKKICTTLIQHEVKLIIAACNTASALANDCIQEISNSFGIKIINVIDPIINNLKKYDNLKNISIIGTKQTIASQTYDKKIQSLYPNIKINSKATPLLVPLIEEGFNNHHIMTETLKYYLNKNFLDTDAIILACTHYPIIKNAITKMIYKDTIIIDSTTYTANEAKSFLSKHALLNNDVIKPKHSFYLTDGNPFFKAMVHNFFNCEFFLEELFL